MDGTFNVFGIRKHPNSELFPAKAIETYVTVASELWVSMTNGYLFRPTNSQTNIVNKPSSHRYFIIQVELSTLYSLCDKLKNTSACALFLQLQD